jgi:hypothetical protein
MGTRNRPSQPLLLLLPPPSHNPGPSTISLYAFEDCAVTPESTLKPFGGCERSTVDAKSAASFSLSGFGVTIVEAC